MAGIFINFRNGIGRAKALHLDSRLKGQFGDDRVFLSSRSISPGTHFPPEILNGLDASSVLLAIITSDWLDAGKDGRRRLDDPNDWVRKEIALALSACKAVFPILVDGTRLPDPADLPEDIRLLTEQQTLRLDHKSSEPDIDRLIDAVMEADSDLKIGSVPGLDSLETGLDQLCAYLKPPLPRGFALMAREAQVSELKEWLSVESPALVVTGPNADDAAAFVMAGLMRTDVARRAVVVTSPDGWLHATTLARPLLVVVHAENVVVPADPPTGMRVVVVRSATGAVGIGALQIPPLPRQEMRELFMSLGVSPSRADQYAKAIRRSLRALRRRTFTTVGTSEWDSRTAPLILVGRWQAGASGDRSLVEQVTGTTYDDVERWLIEFDHSDDPMAHRSGDRWQLVDPFDAWSQSARQLRESDLTRWHKHAFHVLTEVDPFVTAPAATHFRMKVEGVSRQYSDDLRRGIAHAAVMLTTLGDTSLSDHKTARQHSHALVRRVLTEAINDRSGTLWRSLADVLPLLAEAAPTHFLDAVEKGLIGDPPLLRKMFDPAGEVLFSQFSPHTGLLWALEVLSWSSRHLVRVVLVLSKLSAIDPGGRTANRPLRSLHSLIQWSHPFVHIPAADRSDLIEAVRTEEPEVAWQLSIALLDRSHAGLLVMRPSVPASSDWAEARTRPGSTEVLAYEGTLVEGLLGHAARHGARWREIVDLYRSLTPQSRRHVVGELAAIGKTGFETNDLLQVWHSLTGLVARHRKFKDATWAFEDDELDRLDALARKFTPTDDPRRHARLFDWRVDIPGIGLRDHRAHEAALGKLQEDAVTEILASNGFLGLVVLAAAAKRPDLLGVIAADVAGDDLRTDMLPMLTDSALATGWLSRMSMHATPEWTSDVAEVTRAMGSKPHTAFLLEVPISTAVLLLAKSDEGTKASFWQQVNAFPGPEVGRVEFFATLLQHGRAWSVVDALWIHLDPSGDYWRPPADLVAATLYAALKEPPTQQNPCPEYAAGKLLDYLADTGFDMADLARLEIAYYPLIGDDRAPVALKAHITTDPELLVQLVASANPGPGKHDARTFRLWSMLNELRFIPGQDGDSIDASVLRSWVHRARTLLRDYELRTKGEQAIGQILACGPSGDDEAWPCEPIRDVLEPLTALELRNGFGSGILGNRTHTSRSLYEGGVQERTVADQYTKWAQVIAPRWPRVASVLEQVSECYIRQGRKEDAEAQEESDE